MPATAKVGLYLSSYFCRPDLPRFLMIMLGLLKLCRVQVGSFETSGLFLGEFIRLLLFSSFLQNTGCLAFFPTLPRDLSRSGARGKHLF